MISGKEKKKKQLNPIVNIIIMMLNTRFDTESIKK